MMCEVHPSDLRFTQHNIGVSFKAPFNSTRIDDAVDMIISGEWTASTFACIHVVEVDGVLFSLDNRRLWVFRKARLSSITVKLKRANFGHPRLQVFTNFPRTLKKMKSESYFPRVRGKVRQTTWSIFDALNVEQSIFISLAKEHQLPPPVHEVSEVHRFCEVSRMTIDGASGEMGTSTETIDIGTENFKDSAQNVVIQGQSNFLDVKGLKHKADVEQSIIISLAKEQQLPPPHKVSEVHHFCEVSRIPIDGARGESGTSTDTIDIGTENFQDSAQNVVIEGLSNLLDSKGLKHKADDEQSITISLAKEHQFPPVHKVSEVHHFCEVSRITVDGASGEMGTSTDAIDIGTENSKDSAQNVVIEGLSNLLDSKGLKHKADIHCDEQGPPLQHQPVQNDTTVSADLEQGDVQMISTDSVPFPSSSQQWWKSYFAFMIDSAWSCAKVTVQTIWSRAKAAVKTIWSFFKSKFPRW